MSKTYSEGDEMIRLLGFLIGSAVSIGMLLLILGIPDIQFSKSVIDDVDLDSVSKTVEAAKTDIEAVANEVLEEIVDIVDDLAVEEPSTEHAALSGFEAPAPTPEQPTITESANRDDPAPPGHVAQSAGDSTELNASNELGEQDLRWHSFWNPFRSEIAANGFVTQLEKVTGLDYRVVKIKTGVYEVTFAYVNDSERRTKLSQISSATGLDLPDS